MRSARLAILGLPVLLFMSATAMAHHSFAAEFDQNSPVTLTGTVTKVEFQNPHIYFYLDVKDQSGKVVNWSFEGGPPNVLYRQGWRKDSVKPGDILTVKGFRAKDGSFLVAARTVNLPDGREVFGGTPGDGGPQQNNSSGNSGSSGADSGKK